MKGQKKGKKTFSLGLEESMHFTLYEDNLQDNPSVLFGSETVLVETKQVAKQEPNTQEINNLDIKTKPKKSKSFAENLEDFFKESLEEMNLFDGTVATVKRNIVRNSTRPAIGLDVLLQRTAQEDEPETPINTKRVTFILDSEKIEQLSTIARENKKPLNSVVMELIELYLQEKIPPAKKTRTTTRKKV